MDIEKLKLTDDQLSSYQDDILFRAGSLPHVVRELADAQLAKALWGLVDQLNQAGKLPCYPHTLKSTLEAAGIPRPE